MSMSYKLSPQQLKEIAKLPQWMQKLKDEYPVTISNVAEDYELPPLPAGYEPYSIEEYYGEEVEDSYLFTLKGKICSLNLEAVDYTGVTRIMIDGHWAYIQIRHEVLLNRLGGVVLPNRGDN